MVIYKGLSMGLIEVYAAETAEELIELVSPQHPQWQPEPSQWIFRGHADSNWPLVPNALRGTTVFGYTADATKGLRPTHAAQVEAEFDMLEQFLVALDQQGHPLPGNLHSIWFDWSRVQADVRRAAQEGSNPWPPSELLGLLALAQHYGVPTRLLDWSRSARIATYFAADTAARWVHDGMRGQVPDDRLSIWAFKESATRGLWRPRQDSVWMIGTPSEQNSNLRAQQGLFTVHMQHITAPYDAPTVTPFDEIVADALDNPPTDWQPPAPPADSILRELTVPINQAPRLLRLLYYEGISRASLFPSLEGVVNGLVERRYWR
ncbi:MAG: FRG domain-containing protein [Gemmatimonadota bacterium]